MTASVRASSRLAVFPVLAGASVALVAVSAALGPSAAEPPVGRHGWLPPYAASARPADWLVTSVLAAAVVLGAAAVWVALRGRVFMTARGLVVAGAVAAGALSLLPPVGSADPLSYAAYGHAVVAGHDPYAESPATLASHGDRIAGAVEPPWQSTPSVYGPVATAEQAALAWVARDSLPMTVWLLGVANAVAFVVAGLLLQVLARDERERARAAVLWSANPLLLLLVVSGAHLDALVAVGIATALITFARRPSVAGAAAAAAAAVKSTAALAGLALAWLSLRTPRRFAALAAGALAVAVPAYLLAGPHVLDQLARASRMVSLATPWHVVAHVTDPALGRARSRALIARMTVLLALLLAVMLSRGLPGRRDPERAAVRLTAVLVLAWLLAAAYALPWYDASGWLVLALLPASAYDGILLAHTTVLALAYLPGRAVPLAAPLDVLAPGMRNTVSPVLLAIVLVVTVRVSLRRVSPSAP